jgi:hypothetical protein
MGQRSEVRTQGFSVVLVLADLQGTTAQDDVPPAARRALADMKDFLPYKSYKLLDAAWILGQGSSGTLTRLRGPEEQDYELRMSTSPARQMGMGEASTRTASSEAVHVRFTLTETARDTDAEHALAAEVAAQVRRANEEDRRAAELEHSKEVQRLEAELRLAQREKDQNRVKTLQAELTRARGRSVRSQQPTTRPSSKRFGGPVIETSFTMDVGETVVVGTSRLRGNSRALIALLTAVPMKGSRTPVETR